jgi:sterol desaturase/sphingolipid hydroxylase (fatty acid hydroxylase superfamily)
MNGGAPPARRPSSRFARCGAPHDSASAPTDYPVCVLLTWPSYLPAVGILALAFVLLERLRPERPAQRLLRKEFAGDLAWLVFNGYVFALLVGLLGFAARAAHATDGLLAGLGLLPQEGWLAGRAFWVQFLVYLVARDLLEWCVHNLLHRVPALWAFHKVHHSIRELDWVGNFRFHWMELVVYRALLYVPLLYLGGDEAPLVAEAVFATAWGFFNHANVRARLGPLGYLFNSPRMHAWHHDLSDEGARHKNFGVVLSVWDHLFRTAYWPRDRAPARLGYAGDEEMPRDPLRQALLPLKLR